MHWLSAHFVSLKDSTPLVASLLALIFSFISYRQKSSDSKIVLRKQLLDTLKEIADLNIKEATFRDSLKKEEYPKNYVGLLNDQRRYLVRGAAWIADRLGGMVNPFDKVMIAGTFGNMEYPDEAERFFKSAVNMKQSPVELGITLRNYGRFLLRVGRREEGMKMYSRAVDSIPGNTERGLFYRGDTFLRLADDQVETSEGPDAVFDTLEHAKLAFSSITNPSRRLNELARVEEKFKALDRKRRALTAAAVSTQDVNPDTIVQKGEAPGL
jgi:tetratricopeptide (TPR) repeat protein